MGPPKGVFLCPEPTYLETTVHVQGGQATAPAAADLVMLFPDMQNARIAMSWKHSDCRGKVWDSRKRLNKGGATGELLVTAQWAWERPFAFKMEMPLMAGLASAAGLHILPHKLKMLDNSIPGRSFSVQFSKPANPLPPTNTGRRPALIVSSATLPAEV